MILEDLSYLSQIIAAAAVIASLVILILQNYQAGRFARDTATRQQIEGLQNISRVIFETPGMADVWARGNAAFDELSNEDRVRFLAFVTYTHRIWEGLHATFARGQLDGALWRAHSQMLRDVQALQGTQRAWELRKHVFSDAFQAFYESNRKQGTARDIYALSAKGSAKLRVTAQTQAIDP